MIQRTDNSVEIIIEEVAADVQRHRGGREAEHPLH